MTENRMKRGSSRAALATAALALVLSGAFGGCVGPDTDDSETHFLIFCDGACPDDLECRCGVCTKSCADVSACPDVPGVVCESACGKSKESVCDVRCARDHDCNALGATFGCSDGRCRQFSDGGPGPTGSGGATATADASSGGTGSGASAGDASREGAANTGGSSVREGGVRAACRANPTENPTLPAPGTIDLDLLARAGTVFGSCWQDDGVARFTESMLFAPFNSPRYWTQTATQLECLANATCGCSAVEQCLGVTRTFATGDVCEPTCTGDVLRACEGALQAELDCGKVGLRCDTNGGCVAGDATPCDWTTFVPACTADGRATECDDGVVQRSVPCESLGLVCRNGACVGAGAACSDSFPSFDSSPAGLRCLSDGVTLEACWGGGMTQVDCSTRGPGFTCQKPLGERPFCGVATDCSPRSLDGPGYKTNCDGDVVQFCSAGRIERIDCKSLGFVGCEVAPSVARYGCIDLYQCGNGVTDPGEQCDDGNDDYLDGCSLCMWSCIADDDCGRLRARESCQEYSCQDHRCVPSGPRPDGSPCESVSGTSSDDGACTAGVCEFPTTCEGTLYGRPLYSSCFDVDANPCNGRRQCASASAPRGSCAASTPALPAGSPCNDGVCDTSQRCVPSKCGNGVIDADTGEICEPPGAGTCRYDCKR
jgi:cysteine-rich repeat protein